MPQWSCVPCRRIFEPDALTAPTIPTSAGTRLACPLCTGRVAAATSRQLIEHDPMKYFVGAVLHEVNAVKGGGLPPVERITAALADPVDETSATPSPTPLPLRINFHGQTEEERRRLDAAE